MCSLSRILFILLAGVFLTSCLTSWAGTQEVNEKAPEFSLREPGGKELTLHDLAGKPVVLHFWATWCGPCKRELPVFEKLQNVFKDKGLSVILVSVDSKASRKEATSVLKNLGISFPVYFAREGKVPRTYWSSGVPSTYVIDASGTIVARSVGVEEKLEDLLASRVRSLLPR